MGNILYPIKRKDFYNCRVRCLVYFIANYLITDLKHIFMKKFYALAFTLITIPTFSQDVIFTDRPNVTDAVDVIPKGTFQVETGFLYVDNQLDDSETFQIPNISIKYGLYDWLELRVLTTNDKFTQDAQGGSIEPIDETGLTPITFSPKAEIFQQVNWFPQMSLAASLSMPDNGATAFQNDKWNYGFRTLFENNNNLPWAASFGPDWDDTREITWNYTITSGFMANDKLGFFMEIYGSFANDIDDQHGIDGGLSYLLSDDLIADFIVGLPLNKYAPDFLIGAGISWRTNFLN